MDYYGNNDWRDYHLAHYGIFGMHWGIRRFQPYSVKPRGSGKGGKEIGKAKTKKKKGSGHEWGVTIKAPARYYAREISGTVRDVKNAKGFSKKASAVFGNKAAERRNKNRSKYYKEKADNAFFDVNRVINNTRSENAGYKSKYYKKKQSMSKTDRFKNLITKSEYNKTPVRRYSGQLTTRGNLRAIREVDRRRKRRLIG